MEKWENIKGYEGIYQISDKGQVKRIDKDLILKPSVMAIGYTRVTLCKDGKPEQRYIHHLVAEAFLNHTKTSYTLHIHHIDEDRTNNDISNLKIITNRENIAMGFKNTKSKYTGVYWCNQTQKWLAKAMINKKIKFFGRHATELEAFKARNKGIANAIIL